MWPAVGSWFEAAREKKYICEPWEERRMNQRKTIVLCSGLHPCDVLSDLASGDFASNRPGPRFSVCAFACAVRETEAADPTVLGLGRYE